MRLRDVQIDKATAGKESDLLQFGSDQELFHLAGLRDCSRTKETMEKRASDAALLCLATANLESREFSALVGPQDENWCVYVQGNRLDIFLVRIDC